MKALLNENTAPIQVGTGSEQAKLNEREDLSSVKVGSRARWNVTMPLKLNQYRSLKAVLHVLYPHDQWVELAKNKMVIGRYEDDGQIGLRDDSVSRQHCAIEVDKQGLWVKDLGSMNGTRILNEDGESPVVGRVLLKEHDFLIVGNVKMQLMMKRG